MTCRGCRRWRGAIDDLSTLSALARRFDAWFHVDIAYGGFCILVDEIKSRLAGIENVDVTVDEQTVEVSTASTQSLQTSTQTTEGETTTDRTTITRTFTREVPGCSRFEVRLEAKQYVGVVPFEASMTPRNPSPDQLQQCTFKITGSWRGSDVFNTKITSDRQAPSLGIYSVTPVTLYRTL